MHTDVSTQSESVKVKPYLLWWGIGLGAAYWLLESALHTFVFSPEFSFLQTLRGEHDPNEIFMRLVIILKNWLICTPRKLRKGTKIWNATTNSLRVVS